MKLEGVIAKMYHEAQSALPETERAAQYPEPMCLEKHDGFLCTKKNGHTGQHIAHGALGTCLLKWE